ncbi:MAG: hypothetical protein GTO41_28695 [Burkholderiales bacterium]|nr:hypothetical protein [Burkholderiales bacterium]
MASGEIDVAVGCTLAMVGTSLGTRQLVDFTPPASEVDIIDSSHQGTTTAKTFIAADLADYGSFEGTLHHWQDYDHYADTGVSGAVTITLPSGATLVFTGILQSYTPQQATLNEKMLADVVIKVSGDVTVTAA